MSIDSVEVERLSSIRTIDMTTFGRMSGRPSRIEIWWFRFEDRFIITGTPGKRDWLANVSANPRVLIHALGAEFEATAARIDDPDFRTRFFTRPETSWYSSQAEFERLVQASPMIEIQFDSSSPSV